MRALIKADFPDLKEKEIKDLLDPKTWTSQKELLDKAIILQAIIRTDQHDDFNAFEATLTIAIKTSGVELDAKQRKQLIAAVSWTNPDAEPVIKKVLGRAGDKSGETADSKKKLKSDPTYGTFEYRGQLVQFQPDSDLRDNEDVPLTAKTARGANVDAVNEAYFRRKSRLTFPTLGLTTASATSVISKLASSVTRFPLTDTFMSMTLRAH